MDGSTVPDRPISEAYVEGKENDKRCTIPKEVPDLKQTEMREISKPEDVEGLPILQELVERFEGDYSITMSPSQAKKFERFLKDRRHGHCASAPLLCAHEKCPYAEQCILKQQGMLPPILTPCPVETELLQNWAVSRAHSLGIDLDDPKHLVESSEVITTALLDLFQFRASLEMHEKPQIVVRKVVGVNSEGNPIYDEAMNPRVKAILELEDTKSKKWRDLLATRKEKSKAGIRDKNNEVEKSRQLIERAKQLQVKVEHVPTEQKQP